MIEIHVVQPGKFNVSKWSWIKVRWLQHMKRLSDDFLLTHMSVSEPCDTLIVLVSHKNSMKLIFPSSLLSRFSVIINSVKNKQKLSSWYHEHSQHLSNQTHTSLSPGTNNLHSGNTWTSKVVALCHLFTLKHHWSSSAIETAKIPHSLQNVFFFFTVATKPQMFSCGLCTLLWRPMLTSTLIQPDD